MYTQCPDCQTRFRVTADALRVARGTVRCGRCGSAFDALVSLSDTLPRQKPDLAPLPLLLAPEDELAPLREPYAVRLAETLDERFEVPADEPGIDSFAEPSAESTIVLVDEGGAGEDITLEGERVQVEGPAEPDIPANEEEYDLDATDEFEVLRIPSSEFPDEREAERELEALIERLQREFGPMTTVASDAADAHDDTTADYPALGEPETPAEAGDSSGELAADEAIEPSAMAEELERIAQATPPAVPVTPAEPQPAAAPLAEAGAQSGPGPAARQPASPIVVPVEERPLSARRWQPEPAELEQEDAPGRSIWKTLAWSVGSLLLALVLAAQLVHHFRQDLLRDARLAPAVRAAYDRLGIALPAGSDLAMLELRQSGEESRGDGRLVVRARLTNRAGFEQAYPVLRLQFEDRFGSVVAKRDFEPAEYLLDPGQAARPMAPGANSEVELTLADPGTEAVGYRLDVCLRESPAMLRCAQGPG